MCSCPKVHFYEVEFKLAGMRVVATHKNCGDPMSAEQSAKFQKELIQYWGFGDISLSGNKIAFKAGFAGMDDTEADDVKMKIEEYLTMNEAFNASNLSVR